MPTRKRNRMLAFKLNEISFVDRPAQEGALAVIMKRREEDEQSLRKQLDDLTDEIDALGEAIKGYNASQPRHPAGSSQGGQWSGGGGGSGSGGGPEEYGLPGAAKTLDGAGYTEIGGGDDFTSYGAKGTTADSQRTLEVWVYDAHWEGYERAGAEWSETDYAKPATRGKTVESLRRYLRNKSVNKETNMEKELEKLRGTVADLTAQLNAAKAAAPDPKAADEAKKASDAQIAALTKSVEALKAQLAEATAKGDMSDEEKEHYDREKDEEAKKAFLALNHDARKAAITKARSGDEEITVAGQTIRKSAVGDTQFAIFKAQAAQNADLEKRLNAETERRETAEYTKRADEELKELPGETAIKAKVLKAIDKMDTDVKDALKAMLTTGSKAVKAAFESLGHNDGRPNQLGKQGKDAVTAFQKRVEEIAARDKLSKDVAMDKARKEYPDEFQAYQSAT